jgi:hypothetical protein
MSDFSHTIVYELERCIQIIEVIFIRVQCRTFLNLFFDLTPCRRQMRTG